MKKAIIITTINSIENTSINDFKKYDFDIIVIGDLKTPDSGYINNKDLIYLHPTKFNEFSEFSKNLPFNHYTRKNIGYLYAIKNGYDLIFDTDDDNYPICDFEKFNIDYTNYQFKKITNPKFPNMLKLYTNLHIWPRGFPLELVNKNEEIKISNNYDICEIGIFQSLAEGDPDVDAIFRLTNQNYNQSIKFDNNKAYIIEREVYTQGNTQITFWIDPTLFHLLYIPVTVSFRFCDILKMYIAQKCMWQYNKKLCYISPLVKQVRNDHNLLKDFISEYPMYINLLKIVNNIFENLELNGNKNDLLIVYEKLLESGIVYEDEIINVKNWLKILN